MRAAEAKRSLVTAGGIRALEEAVGEPASRWAARCHEMSLKIVRTGLLGVPGRDARVARGTAQGVTAQHSWIVLGGGPYDESAVVADPTIWSYQAADPYVHFAKNSMRTHRPHGTGSIWEHGHPENCHPRLAVDLNWAEPPSLEARAFLGVLGPLDQHGWIMLAHGPVQGWAAGEVVAAIADTFGEAVVPIDILGMTTDRNPMGLYW
jgi:hypothetical protein